ncbi:SIS domain-containing protein [Dactylosporangium aurantiacum]|uniref:SIS domain-containing protein n=1 Tax=Dactylosporangium aurantiacum TaxID=35754 RepID=A0A9Q9MH80_9ACTN|nr:SIS domain-containing protein [Dactylosporangium aurantiacum]MDG6108627.1 SIS domain-containing protein [Dactylosporangium aurantiacum]UWZ59153.1 SIS domain-containing protein [Dactylosporangium aurantiacum]
MTDSQTLDFAPGVNDYLTELKDVIDTVDVEEITHVMRRLLATYERRGSVYVFGNGGSASTASHFVNDFNKGVSEHLEQGFRFYCLNDNVATVMAVANDISYEQVFALQLKNYLVDGDLVLAISGSGESPNVVEAVRYASDRDIETIGLVGFDGGQLKKLADHCIHVPVYDMQKVEDIHLVVNHVMMALFKEHLSAPVRA